MATIYCEFCGAPARDNVPDPIKFIAWMHQGARKDVIRCAKHERSSKSSESCRSHDPTTGARKLTSQEEFQAVKAAAAKIAPKEIS